jgi:hypothetical protein
LLNKRAGASLIDFVPWRPLRPPQIKSGDPDNAFQPDQTAKDTLNTQLRLLDELGFGLPQLRRTLATSAGSVGGPNALPIGNCNAAADMRSHLGFRSDILAALPEKAWLSW